MSRPPTRKLLSSAWQCEKDVFLRWRTEFRVSEAVMVMWASLDLSCKLIFWFGTRLNSASGVHSQTGALLDTILHFCYNKNPNKD